MEPLEARGWGAAVSSLRAVTEVVLGPLVHRPDADWYRAPSGKWCPAQIVEHLALGMGSCARTFLARRDHAPMRRRRRSAREWLSYQLVLRVGWMPQGAEAPSATRPAPHAERAGVEHAFREGVALLLQLAVELPPARRRDLFARHPRLGDLTLPEWLRFFERHCAHHARQIRARLAG